MLILLMCVNRRRVYLLEEKNDDGTVISYLFSKKDIREQYYHIILRERFGSHYYPWLEIHNRVDDFDTWMEYLSIVHPKDNFFYATGSIDKKDKFLNSIVYDDITFTKEITSLENGGEVKDA